MTQADKTFSQKRLPDRIQSLREAINYFDGNPMLGENALLSPNRRGEPKRVSGTHSLAGSLTTLFVPS